MQVLYIETITVYERDHVCVCYEKVQYVCNYMAKSWVVEHCKVD